MNLRPHYIRFKTTSGGGRNSDGEPVAVTETWGDYIPCRFETYTKTNIYQSDDGKRKSFPYVVYIDIANVSEDRTGCFVKIYDGNKNLVKEGQVHHCPFGQLVTVLYVE